MAPSPKPSPPAAFPPRGCGGCAIIRPCGGWCRKRNLRRRTSCCRCSCGPARTCARRSARCRGTFSFRSINWQPRCSEAAELGSGRRHSVRHSRRQGRPGQRFDQRRGHRAASVAGRQESRARLAGDDRRLLLRIHGPRPLRRHQRPHRPHRRRQRRHARTARQPGPESRPGRRRHGGPQRHDGRHGRRRFAAARRRGT